MSRHMIEFSEALEKLLKEELGTRVSKLHKIKYSDEGKWGISKFLNGKKYDLNLRIVRQHQKPIRYVRLESEVKKVI